jgi:ribosome-binding factor A
MPNEHPRSRRVAGQIQRILAEAIRGGVRDPREADVVITDVRVARDLASAVVAVMRLDGAPVDPDTLAGLASASGYLRTRLAGVLATRTVPALHFRADRVFAEARRLDALIDAARAGDAAAAADDAGDEPAGEGDREGEGR